MSDPLLLVTQAAYALAYQLVGKREDALDLIQESATVALSHESAPSQYSADFKPWFFKVVRNRALDQLRRQQRFIHESIDESTEQYEMTEKSDEPEHQLELLQLKNSVHRALLKLTMQQREIILLKDYHGFSYTEIANILTIAKGSVMSRLHRARLELRSKLKGNHSLEGSSDDTV